jgi:hypothetical protein
VAVLYTRRLGDEIVLPGVRPKRGPIPGSPPPRLYFLDQLGAPCSVQTTFLTVLLTARQASWSRTSSAIIWPDTSCNIESWDRRGRVLRASISFVVIGFAASIGTAGAQYLPPEPPPMGYPPPAYYPYRGYPPPAYYGYRGYPPPAYYRANPSAPFHATDQDAGGESY